MSDENNQSRPLTAEKYYARAKEHFKNGNHDDAIDDLTEVIRLLPNYPAALVYRGNVWFEKGEFKKSINDYGKAIQLDPNSAVAWYNRGNAWLKENESDKAINDYNEAIRLRPEFVEALINRGNIWYKKGNFDRSISDFGKAIHLKPNEATAWRGRGNAWLRKEENDLAIADYNEAIIQQPDDALSYNGRGIAWRIKGELDKSLVDHNQAIHLEPDFAYFWVSRGNAWLEQGEYDKAITDCNKAFLLDPNNSYAKATIDIAQRRKKGVDKTINDQTETPHLTSEEKESIRIQTVANIMQVTEPERRTIAEDVKKEYSEQLEKELQAAVGQILEDTTEFRENYKSNLKYSRWLRIIAMLFLVIIAFGVIAAFLFIYYCLLGGVAPGNWGMIVWIPVVTAISAPFIAIWWMLQRWSYEAKTLAYGFQRKAILEERLLLFFRNDAEQLKEMQKAYVVHWMEKSPLEVMLAIGGKNKGMSGENSPGPTPLRKLVNFAKIFDVSTD